MAKTSKYDDDLLLEAVVKYAEVYKGKIKTTELAEWSRKNIKGLEEVRYYHFQRPCVVADRKSKRKKNRPCMLRLEEINKMRTMHKVLDMNVLLKSSNLDEFLSLSDTEKRDCILDARIKVEELNWKNNKLETERDVLQSENQYLSNEIERMKDEMQKIVAEKQEMDLFINSLKKRINEVSKREAFGKLGIENEYLSLVKRNDHLTELVDKFLPMKKDESYSEIRDRKTFAKELMSDLWEDDEDE